MKLLRITQLEMYHLMYCLNYMNPTPCEGVKVPSSSCLILNIHNANRES
jgi:hypothetical protein